MSVCLSNPSVLRVRWETEAGESLEAGGPPIFGICSGKQQRDLVSNQVRGRGCTLTSTYMLQYVSTVACAQAHGHGFTQFNGKLKNGGGGEAAQYTLCHLL